MRWQYSTTDPSQDEFDSLPRLPLTLRYGNQQTEVVGLVDSGATVNVLPYEVGLQLGAVWEERQANIRLAGSLGSQPAIPLFVSAEIGDFAPVRLAFAWTKSPNAPLILGQTNFFMEFDVCFYRSQLEFERSIPSQRSPICVASHSGATFSGPAIIEERESTVIVGEDAKVRVDEFGFLWIELSRN